MWLDWLIHDCYLFWKTYMKFYSIIDYREWRWYSEWSKVWTGQDPTQSKPTTAQSWCSPSTRQKVWVNHRGLSQFLCQFLSHSASKRRRDLLCLAEFVPPLQSFVQKNTEDRGRLWKEIWKTSTEKMKKVTIIIGYFYFLKAPNKNREIL